MPKFIHFYIGMYVYIQYIIYTNVFVCMYLVMFYVYLNMYVFMKSTSGIYKRLEIHYFIEQK